MCFGQIKWRKNVEKQQIISLTFFQINEFIYWIFQFSTSSFCVISMHVGWLLYGVKYLMIVNCPKVTLLLRNSLPRIIVTRSISQSNWIFKKIIEISSFENHLTKLKKKNSKIYIFMEKLCRWLHIWLDRLILLVSGLIIEQMFNSKNLKYRAVKT